VGGVFGGFGGQVGEAVVVAVGWMAGAQGGRLGAVGGAVLRLRGIRLPISIFTETDEFS
jgi:hypothetical protein